MSYVTQVRLENKRVDELTGKFNEPMPFSVNSVEDLAELRAAWLKRESVPCMFDNRDQATDNSFPGLDIRTFLTGDNSSGRVSAHDIIVHPGGSFPKHYQTAGEFYIAVTGGQLEMTVGNTTLTARDGAFAFIPAHTTAAIENKSDQPARLYLLSYPAGVDRAFAEAHALWLETGDTAPEPYLAILERYGFNFNPSGLQENDARTNMKPERLEAEILSIDDFQKLRADWKKRPPIPRLFQDASEEDDGVRLTGNRGGVMFGGDETSGQLAMFYGHLTPGFYGYPHFQPTEEELFYVVDGLFDLTCGSLSRRLRGGAFGFAPRFATHAFLNSLPEGEGTTRVVTVNSPGGHERGFEMQRKLKIFAYADGPEHMSAHGWEIPEPA